MPSDRFSSIVQQIYASSVDPSIWTDTLRAIEDYTESASAVINFVPKQAELRRILLCGRLADQSELHCDLLEAFELDGPERPFYFAKEPGTQVGACRDPLHDRHPRQRLRSYLSAKLHCSGARHCRFSLYREPDRARADDHDVERFEVLVPHLRQAMEMACTVGSLSANWRFGLHILHSLPQAVLGVNDQGIVTFANDAATQILGEPDGLRLADGVLTTCRASDARQLERLLKSVLQVPRHNGQASGWMRLPRPSGRQPYAIFIASLDSVTAFGGPNQPAAVVVIHNPGARRPLDPQTLRLLYGLTETEAKLAVMLGGGQELQVAADGLHIGIGTARTHLKAIFRKVGVNRQQDLVAVLGGLVPLAPDNSETHQSTSRDWLRPDWSAAGTALLQAGGA